jgi:hypothetical protein
MRVVHELAAEEFPALAQRYMTEIAEDLGELERLIDDIIRTARLDLVEPAVAMRALRCSSDLSRSGRSSKLSSSDSGSFIATGRWPSKWITSSRFTPIE